MKRQTKLIIGTQIGFVIGNIICYSIFDVRIELIVSNYIVMNVGYFLMYLQNRLTD